MPTAFEYIRNSDGKHLEISEIDELICTALGWIIHPTDALGFDYLAYTGIAILSQGDGAFEVTKELVDLYIAKQQKMYGERSKEIAELAKLEAHWRRFFYEEYTFKAWWVSKNEC